MYVDPAQNAPCADHGYGRHDEVMAAVGILGREVQAEGCLCLLDATGRPGDDAEGVADAVAGVGEDGVGEFVPPSSDI